MKRRHSIDFVLRHVQADLLQLIAQNFDPAHMPTIIGVGDTVTSQMISTSNGSEAKRGGSDRNFLQLIQSIGETMGTPHVVAYVDSSGGEVKNRRPLKIATDAQGTQTVTAGPGDPADITDPLRLNVVFPGGYEQYIAAFQEAAQQHQANSKANLVTA